MGALMRAFDWPSTSLGPPSRWPQALRTVVRLMLTTNHPMFVFWGTEHLCFYNDAYRASLGAEKHPAMLGARGREMWSEIWHIIGPQIDQVLAGLGATWHEDHLVPIIRNGQLEEVYWTYSYSPIDHADGVGGVLVLCNETTEKVLGAQRRVAELDRLRELFQQAPSFVTVLSGPDHKFEFVNDAYQSLIGARDVTGQPVSQALPEVVSQGFITLLDSVYASGRSHIGRGERIVLERVTGEPEEFFLDFIYKAIRDAGGAVTGVFVEGYDVTERRRSEEALRQSEARYRDVVNSQRELICRFEPAGRILFVNAAYAQSVGKSVEDLLGTNLWTFVSAEDRQGVLELLNTLTPETPEIDIENRFETADGPRWMLWTNRAIRFDPSGALLEAQSTGIDITERRRAEEHRDLLVDELNHRVKNTLTVVQSIARQTFRQAGDPSAMGRAFEGRLAALARAHDTLTKTHWGPARLEDVVRGALHACQSDEQRFYIDGPSVMLDPKMALSIAMAMHELCTNALKYGALSIDKGRVSVAWRVEHYAAGRQLTLDWREQDGPEVSPPQHRGFGSKMIERALKHELGREVTLEFAPDGVRCVINALLPY